MEKVGLVLEGGGMRGVFTSGVLDCMMEHGLYLSNVYGVSAGACNGANYVSRQPGRSIQINSIFCQNRRYMGYWTLLRERSVFSFDFLLKGSDQVIPFDRETFWRSPVNFQAGVTNLLTGKADFIPKERMDEDFTAIRASSSLPLMSPIVLVDGIPCLDGGLSEAIPILQSEREGNQKHVIVLTRQHGYVKGSYRMMPAARERYKAYPAFLQALEHRQEMYNELVFHCERLARQGKAFLIRPQRPVHFRTVERDVDKIQDLYRQGYAQAERNWQALEAFLKD